MVSINDFTLGKKVRLLIKLLIKTSLGNVKLSKAGGQKK